jgi:ABC-type transport system involved in cytochrome c biogenesis ATPase subunit
MTAAAQPRRRSRQRRRTDSTTGLDALGRLQSYSVKGLFGRFDYHFELDAHEPTLLTGVNGTGKSTILRTIDAVSAGRWDSLTEIPFDRLLLGFDGRHMEVSRKSKVSEIVVEIEGVEPWVYRDDLPWPNDVGYRGYLVTGSNLSRLSSEAYAEASDSVALETHRAAIHDSARRVISFAGAVRESPGWVRELRNAFPVLYVTDQRLVLDSPQSAGEWRTSDTVSTEAAVEAAARTIAREIQRAKSDYATVSQNLDRDFPQRVIQATRAAQSAPDGPLRSDLIKLTELRKRLEATGLLAVDEAAVSFAALLKSDLAQPGVQALIETYLKDALEKLRTLEPLGERLRLFTAFLNQHYASKRVVIDQELGFRVEVDGSPNPLPPTRLSSGEQQILVLAHQILFAAKPKTLVLIDEPELSLHVVWQATFVDDLARMGSVADLSFLLATHSPTLIGGREDLKRSLNT